jgi:hypothetical protein
MTFIHFNLSKVEEGPGRSVIISAVNRRRTDNTLTEAKKTRGQRMIYKTLHRKLKTVLYVVVITKSKN